MNQIFLKITQSWLRKNLGKKSFSNIYRTLADIAAEGLNYGNDQLIKNAELNLIKRISSDIPKDAMILDVGANRGLYLKHWLPYTNNIIAFEPGKDAFKALEGMNYNIQRMENIALGSSNETTELFIEKEDNRLNSLYKRNHHKHEWQEKEEVKTKTLDSYAVEHGIRDVYLLKIDVEGHELEVLKGGQKTLSNVRYIQFEFGGAHLDARVQFKDFYDLLSKDFQLYYLLSDGIDAITEYNEKLENYRGNNFFAVSKILS